ncbi:MAG: hypothetical protein MUF34_36710, partial [Polyangiaceae bacterium]|nr:hypothetical protein [Polyangiaceae bacterium]
LAVSTGEFAILDEPTPLLGAPSLGPEAFRDDAVQTIRHPITPTSPAATKQATADRLQALEAGLLTSAPPTSGLRAEPTAAQAGRLPLPAIGVPVRLPPAGPAPSSDDGLVTTHKPLTAPRYPSSSDLLAHFFEAIPALQVIERQDEGVAFILELLAQTMPSRVIFCHVYDAARHEFVLAGARVPSPAAGARLRGTRTAELDPSLEPVLARRGALVVREAQGDVRYQGGRWALAGEAVRSVAAAAAGVGGGRLGLLELANPSDGVPFEEGEGKALEYVAEQFAEFLSRVGAGAGGGGR